MGSFEFVFIDFLGLLVTPGLRPLVCYCRVADKAKDTSTGLMSTTTLYG